MNSGTAVVLDNVAVDRTVRRLAHEIVEFHDGVAAVSYTHLTLPTIYSV